MPLIISQKFSEIVFTIYMKAAKRSSQVKLWKLKTLNKDAITKEIIILLNWFIHIKVFIVEAFIVKQSFVICNTFQAVYKDSVIMWRILQSFGLQNSSLHCKSTKPKNVTHFINVKGWKANTSGKILFGYISQLFKHIPNIKYNI